MPRQVGYQQEWAADWAPGCPLFMPLPSSLLPFPTGSPSRQGDQAEERALKGSSKVPEPRYHQGRPRKRHSRQPVPPSSHPVSQKQRALESTACRCLQQAQSLHTSGPLPMPLFLPVMFPLPLPAQKSPLQPSRLPQRSAH